jgi:hypothetical protein
MASFWKKLVGRRSDAGIRRAEEAEVETPAERMLGSGDVEGLSTDEVIEERLGGVDPERLVDDEFEPPR